MKRLFAAFCAGVLLFASAGRLWAQGEINEGFDFSEEDAQKNVYSLEMMRSSLKETKTRFADHLASRIKPDQWVADSQIKEACAPWKQSLFKLDYHYVGSARDKRRAHALLDLIATREYAVRLRVTDVLDVLTEERIMRWHWKLKDLADSLEQAYPDVISLARGLIEGKQAILSRIPSDEKFTMQGLRRQYSMGRFQEYCGWEGGVRSRANILYAIDTNTSGYDDDLLKKIQESAKKVKSSMEKARAAIAEHKPVILAAKEPELTELINAESRVLDAIQAFLDSLEKQVDTLLSWDSKPGQILHYSFVPRPFEQMAQSFKGGTPYVKMLRDMAAELKREVERKWKQNNEWMGVK